MADLVPGVTPVPDAAGGTGDVTKTEELSIPKFRFDEVSRRAKEYEMQVAELSAKIKDLESKGARVSELEKELEDMKKSHKEEKLTAMKTRVIKDKVGTKVVDFDLLLTLLDLDAIKVNSEGKISGLSAQIKGLQTKKPYLWKPAEVVVRPGTSGLTPPEKSFAQKLAEKKKAQRAMIDKGKNYF